ncbi:MAG TPA: NeuD/PglB/VioB family sugar acetyltransferase [Pirellulaceae bacterium]|mgnify:CR=1 FL=1|nr:NeuD/PglB/VioB family sugar acetyltransferase [Pirellulaceae bacterium]HMO93429.1 NeuD/PglB/VioB family sugar acetyltransferase [Pirellulaceae bacterium]HMP68463.1 NeuD/PglB/VioB family sugar acetyltransferase [Pirellulaceae bacterium]
MTRATSVNDDQRRTTINLRPIWLYGYGGHAKVVADLALACGYEIAGVLDDCPQVVESSHGNVRPGFRLDPNSEIFTRHQPMILCVGNNQTRADLAAILPNSFVSLIHPSAIVSPSALIGVGTVVMQGAVIQADAQIGEHVIINTAASVDHDCFIGNFSHISPNATLCGEVKVGTKSWVGAAAVVIQRIVIGDSVTVGAGAVVIRDVANQKTVVGNPARIIDDGSLAQHEKAGTGHAVNQRRLAALLESVNHVRRTFRRPEFSELHANQRLMRDLEFDSLDLAELTVLLESKYGVDVFADGVVQSVGEVLAKLDALQ